MVLLLDEPLTSLDPGLSKYLRIELRQIVKDLGITAIYVTHDLVEAEEIADRIALIHNGRLEQVAPPKEMFFSPKTEVVSEFIGTPNILNCEYCKPLERGLIDIGWGGIPIILPYEGNMIKKVAIFPRDVYVSTVKPPGHMLNRLKGVVSDIKPQTSVVRVKVRVGNNSLLAELPEATFEEMDLKVGQEVFVILKLRRLRYAERE